MSDNLSKFQFKGYRVRKSLIELQEESNLDNLKIGFKVSGVVNKNNNLFLLNLSVKVTNNENDLQIEVETVGEYKFEEFDDSKEISNFFYINASAILFPYIRAYISTLTNLSGNISIILPTMNLTNLADDLKLNTKVI
ncbi:MAG: protein-export chaperone SecB [Flavobacteriaceae bacterium]|jgi:preprotein translocase subunit SecB|nr:protein-export chaperone SecB [Flavobacteriaceae bacterium]